MSKELKALNRIKQFMSLNAAHWKQDISYIETALKNYEELTNTPPILWGRTHGNTQSIIDYICKHYKEVKITNLEDEEKLKALEIIKEKLVNVDLLMRCDYLDVYNMQMRVYSPIHKFQELTQKEYDLLKEVLGND